MALTVTTFVHPRPQKTAKTQIERLRHFKVEVRREFPHVGRYPEIPKFPHPAL
jgi:hypothetical protein